jgi:hypothetical protein
MRNFLSISCLLLVSSAIYGQSDDCVGCKRTARFDKSTLNDPMGIVGSTGYYSSVFTRVAELVIRPCFHITGKWVDEHTKSIKDNGIDTNFGTRIRVPEYSFESDFVSGLDEYNDEGRPVRSKLTIKLYFEGDQREFVHQWQTIGTWDTQTNSGTSWSGHGNKLKNAYAAGPDITEIVKRFEKRPVDCTINPEKKEVGIGQSIEIKITDLKDENHENSREFNRIVVHALNGTISNGEECDIGPDYKVFIVGNGTVTLHYEAPSDCETGKDKITVYNACEVLPVSKVPFNKTMLDEKIGEKEITISCYDAILTINKIQLREISTSESEEKQSKYCITTSKKRRELKDNIEATISIGLRADVSDEMPIFSNQEWVYYTPVSVDITRFDITYDDNQYSYSNSSGDDCAGGGFENTLTKRRELINPRIPELALGPVTKWIVVFDTKTNKAIKLIPGGYSIDYGYNETESLAARQWPRQSKDNSYTKNLVEDHISFDVGPVEDPVPDPTGIINPSGIKDYLKGEVEDSILAMLPDIPLDDKSSEPSEIQPDLLVKGGNGITEFGGEGHKVTEKQMKGGTEREDLTFTWNMKRSTK